VVQFVQKIADNSEKYFASIFWGEEYVEQETDMKSGGKLSLA
jgi:hypothetical protein